MNFPQTLGDLKSSDYQVTSVKDEMRRNLLRLMKDDSPLFSGIMGYDDTVIPQIQNAILSKHDMLFLGLRGQAKTRMLRQLTSLLDDRIPIIMGSEINDNPFAPVSREARERVATEGDKTPIEWIGRERRYNEKLATPDVTIADLIGEIDMIKHAEGRYLSSELTMHFGLIPRTNRGLFCLNELPDLSPKIQVGLFNVLEERDIQIRGYPIRLELDLCLAFSANPEDYTNRGRIVTPLKDRIGSVIRTHYPLTRASGIAITDGNAWVQRDGVRVYVPPFMKEIVEEIARLARGSSAINQQSGVSVRMSIANFENLISNSERRGIRLSEPVAVPRISDLTALAASTRGKIELTMAEDDGHEDRLLDKLIGEAVLNIFEEHMDTGDLRPIVEWFEEGNTFQIGDLVPISEYEKQAHRVPNLTELATAIIKEHCSDSEEDSKPALFAGAVEFILEGLHVLNRLNKKIKKGKSVYKR